MVYQVLARKWRPKTFSEVIGQDHISRTLQNSVLKQKVAQAYLFTGTRGVGKTTIARIFAKAIRCENLDEAGNPCLECSSCKGIDQANALDYVEIDGASNNSVDNVRELIENAQYLPSSGKFKVYVVDEVHMLSTSAFNALLKTLEEPPAHVVFIFATTDPHKLLGTVLSRCQRFDFKHVSHERLVQHVKDISKKEGINFESEDSVNILARQGNGSVRDTLSLMDQALSLSSGESIDEETVLQSLGLARADSIKELVSALMYKDSRETLAVFDEITRDSVELEKLSNQILDRIFDVVEAIDDPSKLSSLLTSSEVADGLGTAELMWLYEVLLKDFEWGLQSFDPVRSIRFSLLKASKRDEIVGRSEAGVKKKSNNVASEPKVQAELPAELPKEPAEEPQKEPVEVPKEQPSAESVLEEAANALESPISENNSHNEPGHAEDRDPLEPPKNDEVSWLGFLDFTKTRHRGIGMNLERARPMAEPKKGAGELVIGFTDDDKIFSDFLNEPEHFKLLGKLASSYFNPGKSGTKVVINFIDQETKEKQNLYSNVEIEEKKISEERKRKEEAIRENKFIKEAQALFNSEISGIVLNDEDE